MGLKLQEISLWIIVGQAQRHGDFREWALLDL
jgi:hypothetical protein